MPSVITERAFRISRCSTRCRAAGTSKFAADSLGIRSVLYDLNPNAPQGRGNWNALRDEVDESADLIFFHPPYHSMIAYSGNMWGKPHPDDLSRCGSYREFIEKLNFVLKKLYMALRKDGRLAVLVGGYAAERTVLQYADRYDEARRV